MKLARHAHTERSKRSGQYKRTEACDACGKPVGTAYFTDDEVCGNSDGPGFYLCDRVFCTRARARLSVESRRVLYILGRVLNDAEREGKP